VEGRERRDAAGGMRQEGRERRDAAGGGAFCKRPLLLHLHPKNLKKGYGAHHGQPYNKLGFIEQMNTPHMIAFLLAPQGSRLLRKPSP